MVRGHERNADVDLFHCAAGHMALPSFFAALMTTFRELKSYHITLYKLAQQQANGLHLARANYGWCQLSICQTSAPVVQIVINLCSREIIIWGAIINDHWLETQHKWFKFCGNDKIACEIFLHTIMLHLIVTDFAQNLRKKKFTSDL